MLVVDDEPKTLAFLPRLLISENFDVHTAGDGDEAWQMIQCRDYDCILLDIRRPRMSGKDLYQSIKGWDADLANRIVFITGDTFSDETLAFIADCGNPILNKPVEVDEIRKSVREMVMKK